MENQLKVILQNDSTKDEEQMLRQKRLINKSKKYNERNEAINLKIKIWEVYTKCHIQEA